MKGFRRAFLCVVVVRFVTDADIARQQSVADLLAVTKHQGTVVVENISYIRSVRVRVIT